MLIPYEEIYQKPSRGGKGRERRRLVAGKELSSLAYSPATSHTALASQLFCRFPKKLQDEGRGDGEDVVDGEFSGRAVCR